MVVPWWQRWTYLCQEERIISPLKLIEPFFSYRSNPISKERLFPFQSKHPSNVVGITEHCSDFCFIWYSKLNERHIHKLTIVYEKNNVRLIISIFCQSCVLCRIFVCIVHFCHCALSCLLSIGLYLLSIFTVFVNI